MNEWGGLCDVNVACTCHDLDIVRGHLCGSVLSSLFYVGSQLLKLSLNAFQ